MRPASFLPALAAFAIAAIFAVAGAIVAADRIEDSASTAIRAVLLDGGQDWAEVAVDGLRVELSGTAPDEATRFRALSLAGTVVDASRVIDAMEVDPGEPVEPPRFAIEILRNDAGISLIGLVPGAMDRAAVADAIGQIAGGAPVTDLLETAAHPEPEGWATALEFALAALAELPRAKISVAADRVAITAISDSPSAKRRLETNLARAAPETLRLALEISAPRPVITPFTLRFLIDDDGARFDACTAHTETGRDTILAAVAAAGLAGKADCPLGLGVPSPRWPDAAAKGIAALAELGRGSLTFSDADVTLVAAADTPQATFDRVVGRLEADLPEVFSLTAIRPEPAANADAVDGPPEFVATLSPEGLLQLRGRITDARLRDAVEGFARARFSGADVDAAMRVDASLPQGWAARVLAGVEALAQLSNGSVAVRSDVVDIRGATGNRDAKAEISRILSDKLGEAGNFTIAVQYQERLDPLAALPTPEECAREINAVLRARQITFDPGSDEIDAESQDSVERIAEIMVQCAHVPMEVGGHTDSQGRESMNQQLSQRRAEAVLEALRGRRVLTGSLTAVGYGESAPIADNKTEAGREANRRIEFKLISPETETVADVENAETAADAAAAGETETQNEPD